MKYYLTLFLCVLFLPVSVFASVTIDEVAWMGTPASQYSEWLELHNDGNGSVSLDGWKIYKTGNVLLYTLSKTISAGGYLLVERTTPSAPDAVPGINDESGTFGGEGLRNSGEDLTLVDTNGNTVNSLPFAGGWPAGDAKTKETMQWGGTAWITAAGTPDAANASKAAPVASEPTITTPIVQTSSPETTPITSVVISPPSPTISTTPVTATTSPITDTVPTNSEVISPAPSQPNVVQTQPVTADITSPLASTSIMSSTTKPVMKTVKKKTTPAVSKATVSPESSVDSLEDPTTQPVSNESSGEANKENNHTKIIIFGAVILIGTALFLLLERFKAQEE